MMMLYHFFNVLLLDLAVGADEGTCAADGNCAPEEDMLKANAGLYRHEDEFIFKRLLKEEGINKGDPCSQEILNKYDNMNYYGANASRDMLKRIQMRGGNVRTFADLGSGYGGTTRVLTQALGAGSIAYGIDIRDSVTRAARSLDSMAALAGDIPSGAINRVRADVVKGIALDGSLPEPGSLDLVVSRMMMLHVPKESRDAMWKTLTSWLKPGAMVAIEDLVAEDDGIPENAKTFLNDKISIPGGWLPTKAEYKASLESHGFKEVRFNDVTDIWKTFVHDRVGVAKAMAKDFDEKYGEQMGKDLRGWYDDMDFVLNPPEDQPTGNIGVRIYATKS
eukprot:gnl/MRDRNA2_/MRDRNA2_79422_c0_seq1.p1 gnl/MRDRNA2_/MRDRNA2_79422_c0~~gnl/MRDRNA2_/MRDRNA2_79422_c0_seq1.p1  ORF type:complete len:335 (-),score=70.61 gnl/MRDRNA2_/MRDRNA2_79422_c0_seq1:155-1159(-)